MSFWDINDDYLDNIAVIIEDGQTVTYRTLFTCVDKAALQLQKIGSRQLGFIFTGNTLSSLIAYLACLRIRHVALLLPNNMTPELISSLKAHYHPDWIIGSRIDGELLEGTQWRVAKCNSTVQREITPELALLLSTSGSTGSPKLVKLSYKNLQANAKSISQYLDLTPKERALTVLPSHYSYGLSIINSHLYVGASLALRDVSVISPVFAEAINTDSVTSISGVPYIYQMLFRTGFAKKNFPTLRTLTQAGGRLDNKLTDFFAKLSLKREWRFFSMYGQTEATARISYVPPDRLVEKIGSIGIAIPGGRLEIDPKNSELIYTGDNVMLGYATCSEDLALNDIQQGVLRTGDVATQDADGFFYITGRLKRFIKLVGNRIGLDEVELQLQDNIDLPVMVGGRDDVLLVWIESDNTNLIEEVKGWLASRFGIHHSVCRFKLVNKLPLLSSGKKDYSAMSLDI